MMIMMMKMKDLEIVIGFILTSFDNANKRV